MNKKNKKYGLTLQSDVNAGLASAQCVGDDMIVQRPSRGEYYYLRTLLGRSQYLGGGNYRFQTL
jgi:hypothetical protein